jgi:hypothetical protein
MTLDAYTIDDEERTLIGRLAHPSAQTASAAPVTTAPVDQDNLGGTRNKCTCPR